MKKKILSTILASTIICSLHVLTYAEDVSTEIEFPTAEELLIQLKAMNSNMLEIQAFDENSDPNKLLGTPDSYIGKANFSDIRVEQYDTLLSGGTVEVFADAEDCDARAQYLELLSNPALGAFGLNEYIYQYDTVIFRVTHDLTEAAAEEYHEQMDEIMSQYTDIEEEPDYEALYKELLIKYEELEDKYNALLLELGEAELEETTDQKSDADLANQETVYELISGNYTAGIDIPSGRCNVTAISGQGNLSSSNMWSGGINEMFGVDDGSGWYVSEFKGLKLPEGTVLSADGNISFKLEFTSIDGSASGRKYDESAALELSTGNYISGTDFPSGTYSIEAVSGQGNIHSSNIFDGGINEMFGIDDGTGWYTSKANNIDLPENTELEISGGVIVRMIPSTN